MDADFFISLVIAHIIGDFYLQTDYFCEQKATLKLKSPFLYLHALIVGLLSWLLVPTHSFWLCFLIITVSHLSIDIIKVYLPHGLGSFCLDQLAHVAVLTAIAASFRTDITLPIQWMDFSPTFSAPWLLLAILLCLKPANIFIKLVLGKYQVGESETCNDIKNAGALIGDLERLLTILFVMLRQFEAIGFIVAAKSLLRFKETDTAKTEYVLAGTFLSFGIAIACGLMV
ncbi:MAG: DUF3307 domain-containing protein [Bacteroidales bacterium]|nr:DUF3307 domain-containing protein [Bacteroidales bacterium]